MARPQTHSDFKDQARRQWKAQVLKAAAQAFKKSGYHGTSMDDIAARLNITKGNLYYYFKNKEAILFDCHMACLDIAQGLIDELAAQDQTPAETLHAWITGYLERMLEDLVGSVILTAEEGLSARRLEQIVKRRDVFERSLRRVLAEGMSRGEFPEGDPRMLTFAILGSINWTSKWYDPEGEKRPPEIAAFFADWIVSGLLGKRAVQSPPPSGGRA
ncbi:MAG: TetR/AcrR family transcriptional regulator [Proteobacteria bacterium]|nr:TetR/AcrR family transcriptional regulator [Pseudomonadota bacterium]